MTTTTTYNYSSKEAIEGRIKGIKRAIRVTRLSIKNFKSDVRDDSDLKAYLKYLNKTLKDEQAKL